MPVHEDSQTDFITVSTIKFASCTPVMQEGCMHEKFLMYTISQIKVHNLTIINYNLLNLAISMIEP